MTSAKTTAAYAVSMRRYRIENNIILYNTLEELTRKIHVSSNNRR